MGALIEGASLSPKTENSLSSMAAEKLALGSDSDCFWVTVSRIILIQYNLIQFHHCFYVKPRPLSIAGSTSGPE